ncbi:MAG: carboxymuconolactone decarboxylase family protein, partial [Actinomycetota bacterium]|nr:carboxymuconolactone decarboxylase family protein [Actinomycetota bacterium]
MARISLVDLDGLPEPQRSAYEAAVSGRTGPRIHLHETLAHSPAVLVAVVELANALRNGTGIDPRLRELIIVTVSNMKGAGYESGKHWNLALSLGVTREQLTAIEAGADPTEAGC